MGKFTYNGFICIIITNFLYYWSYDPTRTTPRRVIKK